MSIAIDIKPSSSTEDAYPTSGLKSLYIPRVFLNITEEKIREVFERLELGEIERIDLVPRPYTSGTISANMAFIYFKYWSQSVSAQNLASRIMDPHREARIVYDDPWYWILLPNRRPQLAKPAESDRIGVLKSIIQNLSTRIEILEKNVLFHPNDPFPGGPPILFRQNAENNVLFHLPNRRPQLAKPSESDRIDALKSIIQNLSTRFEILDKNVLFHPDDPFPGGHPILFRQNAENNVLFHLPNRRPQLAKPTESDRIDALKSIIQNLSTRIEILEKNVLFHPDDPFPGGHPILFRQNAENKGRFPQDDVESNTTTSYEETVIIPEPPKLHRLVSDARSFPSSPESIDNSEAREVTETAHDEQSESSECVYSDDEHSVSIDELWVKLRPPQSSNQKKNVCLSSLSPDDIDKRLMALSIMQTVKIDENGQRFIRVDGKWYKDNGNALCDP